MRRMVNVTWLDVAAARPANLNRRLRLRRKVRLGYVDVGIGFNVRSSNAQSYFGSIQNRLAMG